MKDLTEAVLSLGKLVLAFARVERFTRHEDGSRLETDTDHTVMLGIIACAYAKEVAPHLDPGLVAQYALVHDLVEAYAGDTVTLKVLTDADHADKAERERAALERIREEFGQSLPWVHETIEAYESLATPEARFVKLMDKCMPGITHFHNGGAVLREAGYTPESLAAFRAQQRENYLASYGQDQPEALRLWDEIVKRDTVRESESGWSRAA